MSIGNDISAQKSTAGIARNGADPMAAGILRDILGDRVFLPVAPKQKAPKMAGWPDATHRPTAEELETWGREGNLVVLSDPAPGGLVAIDIDNDEEVNRFLDANGQLRETPRVVGERGCKLFLCIEGKCPPFCTITNGCSDIGEWRSFSKSTGRPVANVVWGTHPAGMKYQWHSTAPVPTVRFHDIVWPEGWKPPRVQTDLEELCERMGEPAVIDFPENKPPKLQALNHPHWAARLMLVHDALFEPSEGRFYCYDPDRGLWEPQTKALLKAALSADLREWAQEVNVTPDIIRKTTNYTLADILTLAQGEGEVRDAFRAGSPLVHVANGMVDITNRPPELKPFSREHFSRNQCPWPWTPKSHCERFINELLLTALPDDDVDLLQRWLGSVLLRGNRAQRILLLTGTAGGGKGTLMEIIESIIGRANVAQFRTEQLAERFEMGRLIGRQLLVGKDVAADFLQHRSSYVLKALVGHDLMTGERKGSNEALNFRGEFSVAIVSNSRLRVRLQGDDAAWRRRLMLIEYSRPKPQRRIDNFARMLLEEEGEGILAWAIEGAQRHLAELEEHGDFVLTAEQSGRVDALLAESNSVRRFIELHVEPADDCDVTGAELMTGYVEYCERMGWSALPERQVQGQLPDIMLDLFRAPRRTDIKRAGKNQRGYAGVTLHSKPREEEGQ